VEDFTKSGNFGRGGSIRNLLVHIANVYQFWVGKHALAKTITFTKFESIKDSKEVKQLFVEVDELMNEFISRFAEPGFKNIEYEIGGKKGSAEPFEIFTHVITHEFHHKGQILSLSRQLGYTPVDTDIIRTS
jgi:uncharacterized damage-inducible protein DinB